MFCCEIRFPPENLSFVSYSLVPPCGRPVVRVRYCGVQGVLITMKLQFVFKSTSHFFKRVKISLILLHHCLLGKVRSLTFL